MGWGGCVAVNHKDIICVVLCSLVFILMTIVGALYSVSCPPPYPP